MACRCRGLGMMIALAALAAGAGGCNYFRPATAPGTSAPPVPQDYSQPDATLETIRLAVEAKGQSGAAEAYVGAFADSTANEIPGYHQFFWPEDAAAWKAANKTVPSDWNLKLERLFYNYSQRSLVNLRPEPYQMIWEPDPDNSDRQDVNPSILHRRYTLLAIGATGEAAEVIARGFADLTLHHAGNGNWYITRWEDRPDPVLVDPKLPQVTWGQRRLESQ